MPGQLDPSPPHDDDSLTSFSVRSDTGALQVAAMHVPLRLPLRDRLAALADVESYREHQERSARTDARPAFPYGQPETEAIHFDTLREQQQRLVRTLRDRGVRIVDLPHSPGSPAQMFTRDLAFVIDDTLFLCRPVRPDRQRELDALRAILPPLANTCELSAGTIEGGDVIVQQDRVLVGMSAKTSPSAVAELRSRLRDRTARAVVPVHLAARGIAHLDMVFTPVTPELALAFRPAIDPQSLDLLESWFELIDVDPDDMRSLAVNCVSVGDDEIVIDRRATNTMKQLARRGIQSVPIDYDHASLAGGGLHCSVLPWRRGPHTA